MNFSKKLASLKLQSDRVEMQRKADHAAFLVFASKFSSLFTSASSSGCALLKMNYNKVASRK